MIKGDVNYKFSDGVFKKVTRKNKLVKDIMPNVIAKFQIKTNAKKINDVKKLLITHYGDLWQQVEELTFYQNVFAQNPNSTADIGNSVEEVTCEPQEEDSQLRV